VVTRIKADGHEVGNHYVMDASVLVHSDAAFLDYLEKSDKAIGIVTRPKLFRPPGGVAWPRLVWSYVRLSDANLRVPQCQYIE